MWKTRTFQKTTTGRRSTLDSKPLQNTGMQNMFKKIQRIAEGGKCIMVNLCTKCKKEIPDWEGIHYIEDKPHCEVCYFSELGAMMEKYPPGFPVDLNPYKKS